MKNIRYDNPPLMARCDIWLSGFIYKGAAGMRPESNRAMDGLFANFILKAKHHNTVAPSLGEHFLASFLCLKKKLGCPSEHGLKIQHRASDSKQKEKADQLSLTLTLSHGERE